MSKKVEKHDSELSMDELENVAGGVATPVAPTPAHPSASTSPKGPGTGISRETDTN